MLRLHLRRKKRSLLDNRFVGIGDWGLGIGNNFSALSTQHSALSTHYSALITHSDCFRLSISRCNSSILRRKASTSVSEV